MHGGIQGSPETKLVFKVIYYSYIFGFCFTGLILGGGLVMLLSIPDIFLEVADDDVFLIFNMNKLMILYNLLAGRSN